MMMKNGNNNNNIMKDGITIITITKMVTIVKVTGGGKIMKI